MNMEGKKNFLDVNKYRKDSNSVKSCLKVKNQYVIKD